MLSSSNIYRSHANHKYEPVPLSREIVLSIEDIDLHVAVPTADAVPLEIGEIERENLGGMQGFRSHNEGSVRQVHRVIPILLH